MTKLKLGPLPDDKPVKVTVELPAPLHRDLVAYAEVLGRESGQIGTATAGAKASVGRGRSEFATATANLRQSRLSNTEGRNAYDGPGRGHA